MKQRLQVRAARGHAAEKQACEGANNANMTEHAVVSIETNAATETLKRVQRKIKNTLNFPLAAIDRRTGDYADRNIDV